MQYDVINPISRRASGFLRHASRASSICADKYPQSGSISDPDENTGRVRPSPSFPTGTAETRASQAEARDPATAGPPEQAPAPVGAAAPDLAVLVARWPEVLRADGLLIDRCGLIELVQQALPNHRCGSRTDPLQLGGQIEAAIPEHHDPPLRSQVPPRQRRGPLCGGPLVEGNHGSQAS